MKSPMPRYAYFRGEIVPYESAKVGVLTQALNYGTGCFGGLRGYWSAEEDELFVFRPRDHFTRFLESTKLLSMELDETADDLLARLKELLAREQLRTDCYIRPLAFLSDETIGVRLHDLGTTVSMVAFPFGKYLDKDDGAHLTVSAWRRVPDSVIPARGKISGSYVNSALAKTDAHRAGFDDALLLDAQGHVTEASAANFFLVRNGILVTPPVTDSILEGITRRTLIALAKDEMGIEVHERSIDRTEVYLADEAFLAGTGVQLVPVTRVDHRPVGRGVPGEVTRRLREIYSDVVRGRARQYRKWCEPVYAVHNAGAKAKA